MLFIVLILVLAALGLLITSLITSVSLWAWISIGLSVLAALILVIDWLRRRSKRNKEAARQDAYTDLGLDEEDAELGQRVDEGHDSAELAEDGQEPHSRGAEQTTVLPASGTLSAEPAEAASAEASSSSDESEREDSEPEQEQTDETDALIVSKLDADVLVVDEHPRYHLEKCGWLGERETIPIAVAEARELGFTPCGRCGPDVELVTQYHKQSGSSTEK